MSKKEILETDLNENFFLRFLDVKYCSETDDYELYDSKSDRFFNKLGQEISMEEEDFEVSIYRNILEETDF